MHRVSTVPTALYKRTRDRENYWAKETKTKQPAFYYCR